MTQRRLVAGKYRLRSPLGHGAMGVVWAATHEATDRQVAVKLVSRNHATNQDLRARMLREARACGRIGHKNVIEILDAGQTDEGEPFLVMPLLKGESLASLLERKGSLEPTEAVHIAIDVAKGLAAAHAADIVHRDLKPANIFLVPDEDEPYPLVKILDFGVSKLVAPGERSSDTMTGSAVGSPAYMSPEQGRGDKAIDQRSDVWALGVVLYEMLTGVRAFDGPNAFVVVSSILNGPIPSVADHAPGMDRWLVDLVGRCLVRNARDRIPSAKEFIALARRAGGMTAIESANDTDEPTTIAARAPRTDEDPRARSEPDESSEPSTPSITLQHATGPSITSTTPLMVPAANAVEPSPPTFFEALESPGAAAVSPRGRSPSRRLALVASVAGVAAVTGVIVAYVTATRGNEAPSASSMVTTTAVPSDDPATTVAPVVTALPVLAPAPAETGSASAASPGAPATTSPAAAMNVEPSPASVASATLEAPAPVTSANVAPAHAVVTPKPKPKPSPPTTATAAPPPKRPPPSRPVSSSSIPFADPD